MPLEQIITESANDTELAKNKPTKDGVNPYDIREERRPKGNKHGHGHEKYSRAAFDYERLVQRDEFRMEWGKAYWNPFSGLASAAPFSQET